MGLLKGPKDNRVKPEVHGWKYRQGEQCPDGKKAKRTARSVLVRSPIPDPKGNQVSQSPARVERFGRIAVSVDLGRSMKVAKLPRRHRRYTGPCLERDKSRLWRILVKTSG